MTVVIGYTSQSFSILATDTRLFVNGRKEDGIVDDYNKLYDLPYPLGWCCGAGFNHVLLNFIELLNSDSSIIGGADFEIFLKSMFDRTKLDHPTFTETINRSSIFATWFYGNHENKKLHSIANYFKIDSGGSIAVNTYFVDFPYDYTDEMINEIELKYRLRDTHSDSLDDALNKIFQLFGELSSNSEGVSRICDIGVQVDDTIELRKYRIKEIVSII